jgi:antitoxin HicB
MDTYSFLMKTYIFRIEIEQEEDGRWSAEVPSLPGCATWGYTQAEALRSIHEATQLYIESLLQHGDSVPAAAPTEVMEEPAVAITV